MHDHIFSNLSLDHSNLALSFESTHPIFGVAMNEIYAGAKRSGPVLQGTLIIAPL